METVQDWKQEAVPSERCAGELSWLSKDGWSMQSLDELVMQLEPRLFEKLERRLLERLSDVQLELRSELNMARARNGEGIKTAPAKNLAAVGLETKGETIDMPTEDVNSSTLTANEAVANLFASPCRHKSETASTFDMFVVQYVLFSNRPFSLRCVWLFLGLLMTVAESFAIGGLIMSSIFSQCARTSDCNLEGQYCSTSNWGGGGTCVFCNDLKMLLDVDAKSPLDFCSEQPSHDACHACSNPINSTMLFGSDWGPGMRYVQLARNVNGMRWFDWLCLAMTAFVVGMEVHAEGEDLIAARRMASCAIGRRLERRILWLMHTTRQFGVLPMLMWSITQLAIWSGSDSKSIFLNCFVATFMLRVDDALFVEFVSKDLLDQMAHAVRMSPLTISPAVPICPPFLRVLRLLLWTALPVLAVQLCVTVGNANIVVAIFFFGFHCGFLNTATYGFFEFYVAPMMAGVFIAFAYWTALMYG